MFENDYACVRAKSLQSCLALCNPADGSPPGSSIHGILQARILEWVSMPASKITIFCLIRSQTNKQKETGRGRDRFAAKCMASYGGRFFLKSK